MRLRLVSNCMSLPVLYFISFLTKTTTFNRHFHIYPFPLSHSCIYLALRISTGFFSLSHYPSDTFVSSTDSPFSDITECRSENKKTSRASGTKVHIHIINLRFVKKTIETRKNKPTRFFVFFFLYISGRLIACLPESSSISRDSRRRLKELRAILLILKRNDLFCILQYIYTY